MSAVTVTTKHDLPMDAFDPESHRQQAAGQLGLDHDEIHCTSRGTTGTEEITPALYSEDGTLLKPAVVSYEHSTTWAEKPRAVVEPEPEPYKEPPIAWPEHSMPRGSKWHGAATVDGVTDEYTFISDGKKLVLLESAEGEAVLTALEGEHVAHQAATGG